MKKRIKVRSMPKLFDPENTQITLEGKGDPWLRTIVICNKVARQIGLKRRGVYSISVRRLTRAA
jgi:hypothetical protein